MSMGHVNARQRFTQNNPCPVCRGAGRDERGAGVRCFGYLSEDGNYAHCTREDRSPNCPFYEDSQTYAHWLKGTCKCGVVHDTTSPTTRPRQQLQSQRPRPASPVRRTPDVVYTYEDPSGTTVMEVLRFGTGKGKTFSQRRPNGKGGYIDNLDGVERTLYHLPDILSAPPAAFIFVFEGEKDVDTARGFGLFATCNAGGAGKWRKGDGDGNRYAQWLTGRNVIIVPDEDVRGLRHADLVAESLYGLATSVRIAHLPDLPDGGKDLTDWIDAGHSTKELVELAKMSPVWTPGEPDAPPHPADTGEKPKTRLLTIDEVGQLPPPEWLLQPDLQKGGIAVLAGNGGIGKTFIALNMALIVAQTNNVIYIAAEEPVQLYPRATAWQKHYDKLSLDNIRVWPEPVQIAKAESLAEFMLSAREYTPALIVVDTLSVCSAGLDENDPKDMGVFMGNCRMMAAELNANILLIHHTNRAGEYRGSSKIFDDATSFITAMEQDGKVRLRQDKQRHAMKAPDRLIGWVDVEGERVAVPDEVAPDNGKLTDNTLRILEALNEPIFVEFGAPMKTLLEYTKVSQTTAYTALNRLTRMQLAEQRKKFDPIFITEIGKQYLQDVQNDAKRKA